MSPSGPSQTSKTAVIGFDFGGTKVDVALADDVGNVLERVRLPMGRGVNAERAVRQAAERARGLAAHASERHGRSVIAYAAVTPGLPMESGVLLAPNLPEWERLPFARTLADCLDVEHVTVANDVRAGALAEVRLGALRGIDPGLYVSIGTGLAAALVIDGRIVHGAHGVAGEIGYSAVELTAGPTPGTAFLEEIVGGRGLGHAATAALGEPADAAMLFSRREPRALEIVERAMATLAAALTNLALLVDPARIALGGGVMAAADRILPAIRARLTSLDGLATAPDVVAARFVQDASLHGAITLALDSAGAGGGESVAATAGAR